MQVFHLYKGQRYEIMHMVMSKYNIDLHLIAVLNFQNLEIRNTCVWNVYLCRIIFTTYWVPIL